MKRHHASQVQTQFVQYVLSVDLNKRDKERHNFFQMFENLRFEDVPIRERRKKEEAVGSYGNTTGDDYKTNCP